MTLTTSWVHHWIMDRYLPKRGNLIDMSVLLPLPDTFRHAVVCKREKESCFEELIAAWDELVIGEGSGPKRLGSDD